MSLLWRAGWRWASVWGLHVSPIVHVGELPELMPLVACDRSNWPHCMVGCLVLAQAVSVLPGPTRWVNTLIGLF